MLLFCCSRTFAILSYSTPQSYSIDDKYDMVSIIAIGLARLRIKLSDAWLKDITLFGFSFLAIIKALSVIFLKKYKHLNDLIGDHSTICRYS